ncbi:MAG: hypothetical protein LBV55_00830 [Acholeplasmatales bacterium]|jgi:acyl-ACP thioesterase|nr:hypothetical protein [Acholeplasmatales bacterium]
MKPRNTLNYLVGLSDCDQFDRLRLTNLLAICNNLEFYQLLEEKYYQEAIISKTLVTVLSYRYIEILRWPKLHEKIIIKTYPYSVTKALGLRHTVIYDEQMKIMVKLYSEGPLWDLVNKTIRRYNIEEIKLLNSYPKQDIEIQRTSMNELPSLEVVGQIVITNDYLDRYNHVSNVKYVAIFEKYLTKYYNIIEIIYKSQAVLGDELVIWKNLDASHGRCVIKITRNTEIICLAISKGELINEY